MLKMVILQILIVLPLLVVHNPAQAELFTALVDLSRGINAEQLLSDALMHYVTVEQNRLSRVYELGRQLAEHSQLAKQFNPEQYLSNPINAFLLVKRFTLNWRQDIRELIEKRDNMDVLLNKLDEMAKSLPNEEDLVGSADALLRLQATYRLDTHTVANGVILPESRSYPMNAEECFYLGKHAYNEADYHYSQQWMRETLHRMDTFEEKTSINRTLVLDYLSFALFKTGSIQQAKEVTEELIQLDPFHERAKSNLEHYVKILNADPEELKAQAEKIVQPAYNGVYDERSLYEALCRAEPLTFTTPQDLYCRYYVPHPHYLIGPVKEEVMYHQPRLIIWHDIIHPEEIEKIKNLAIPNLRRATVQNAITGKLEYAQYRISKSAWLPYDMDDVTKTINDRIVAITGLNIDTAEDLQVVNYGIGGQYEPHFDFARKRERSAFEKKVGNRIATLIYYLSDIDAGGLTVFTEIGVKIKPIRGAAAFWWNLLPSGEGDLATRHAACPVLVGSKWVMNKWFHERGQEFLRPCKLDELAFI